jgi:hypothetical protein
MFPRQFSIGCWRAESARSATALAGDLSVTTATPFALTFPALSYMPHPHSLFGLSLHNLPLYLLFTYVSTSTLTFGTLSHCLPFWLLALVFSTKTLSSDYFTDRT